MLDKAWVANFVHQNRTNVDVDGNLNAGLVAELKYCAKPVLRALNEFEKNGMNYSDKNARNIIDQTFLKGFWTPQGFVDNAKIIAEENKD